VGQIAASELASKFNVRRGGASNIRNCKEKSMRPIVFLVNVGVIVCRCGPNDQAFRYYRIPCNRPPLVWSEWRLAVTSGSVLPNRCYGEERFLIATISSKRLRKRKSADNNCNDAQDVRRGQQFRHQRARECGLSNMGSSSLMYFGSATALGRSAASLRCFCSCRGLSKAI
jgi:hypothetical protein